MKMNFKEAFGIKKKDVIGLVGAGGKTTLMYLLANELSGSGRLIITTTTTKILPPDKKQSPFLLIEKNSSLIIKSIPDYCKYGIITLASEMLSSGKLDGISPELVDKLIMLDCVDNVIVEADGAAQKPLKAPREGEPVFAESMDIIIAVVGIDSYSKPFNEDVVFRSDIARKMLNISGHTTVTADIIADLIIHPKGLTRGAPPGARIIPFINKVESNNDIIIARQISDALMSRQHSKIDRVVIGSAATKIVSEMVKRAI